MSSPYYRRQATTISFGGPLTPGVKYIILATLGVFVLQLVFPRITEWFALYPPAVFPGLQIWRLVTWLFVHGGIMHILFNMLFLFMFGCQLERAWGTRFFVRFYFICGIGAGLFAFLPIPAFYGAHHIGASGAIYSILMAYGMFFPRNVIYFMLMFPIEARYFVIILGFFAFYGSLQGAGSGVSHIAHLGGLVVGYVYLRRAGARRRGGRGDWMDSFRQGYRKWRMKRLRKKFERYYEERTGGDDTKYKYH
jgi:membrane associated rhomboid family serine protease